MVHDKSTSDVDNVSREVDQNGEQRAELNHRDGGRGLLGLQRLVRATVKIDESSCENQMRRRTNRDKFSQALNETQEDSLEDSHILRIGLSGAPPWRRLNSTCIIHEMNSALRSNRTSPRASACSHERWLPVATETRTSSFLSRLRRRSSSHPCRVPSGKASLLRGRQSGQS